MAGTWVYKELLTSNEANVLLHVHIQSHVKNALFDVCDTSRVRNYVRDKLDMALLLHELRFYTDKPGSCFYLSKSPCDTQKLKLFFEKFNEEYKEFYIPDGSDVKCSATVTYIATLPCSHAENVA